MSASLKARSRGQAPPTPSGDWVSRQREPGSWGPLVGGGGSFPAQHLLLAAAHLELSHSHSSARVSSISAAGAGHGCWGDCL